MHFVKEKFLYFDPNSLNFFPEGQTDDKSSLVHQLRLGAERVTSHCLNQGWPTSMILIYNTRPQLVNTLNLCTLSPDHGMFWHLLRHFFQASQLFEGCLLGICWHLTGTANKTKSLINKSSLLRNKYWMPSCALHQIECTVHINGLIQDCGTSAGYHSLALSHWHGGHFILGSSLCSGGRFKNTYALLNLRALKISHLYKNCIFQCMGMIFCVEFERYPLKFHTKYLTHTLKDVDFIHWWKFKSC